MMISDVITTTERYLRQQQLLRGDVLFTAAQPNHAAEMPHNTVPVEMPEPQPTLEAPSPPTILTMNTEQQTLQMYTEDTQHSSKHAAWQTAPNLNALYEQIHTCMNCKLGATRTNFVFGVGNPHADIMVIGEAPGADEDAQGEPFVGRAGQLLTKILEAIGLRREEVYIANIIKCRPPDNRRPEADEVAECEPYLHKQIDLVQPKFILAVGLTAVNTLFKANFKMGDIRGKQLSFRGIPTIITYHPAALLRNPEWKKFTWEDVKLLRRLYDEHLGQPSMFA
jgi:DNA polymerase